MQLVVAFIGPPRTPGIAEPIVGAGGWPVGLRRGVCAVRNCALRMGSPRLHAEGDAQKEDSKYHNKTDFSYEVNKGWLPPATGNRLM